jgi:acyl-CoA synthetase (AMP-forming)/AMP-acid ligase II
MPTIGATLRTTAARVPDRAGLGIRRHRYTDAELDREVDRVAGLLAERGSRKGDRLALLAADRFVIAFYAAHRLGAIFVPINPASGAPKIDHILRDSGAACLIFDVTLQDSVRAAIAADLPDELRILALGNLDGSVDQNLAPRPRPMIKGQALGGEGPVAEVGDESQCEFELECVF